MLIAFFVWSRINHSVARSKDVAMVQEAHVAHKRGQSTWNFVMVSWSFNHPPTAPLARYILPIPEPFTLLNISLSLALTLRFTLEPTALPLRCADPVSSSPWIGKFKTWILEKSLLRCLVTRLRPLLDVLQPSKMKLPFVRYTLTERSLGLWIIVRIERINWTDRFDARYHFPSRFTQPRFALNARWRTCLKWTRFSASHPEALINQVA